MHKKQHKKEKRNKQIPKQSYEEEKNSNTIYTVSCTHGKNTVYMTKIH